MAGSKLKDVTFVEGWPPTIPKPRPRRSSRRAGLTYEKKLATHVSALNGPLDGADVMHGRWIAWHDEDGPGLAQPDILIVPKKGPILVIEAKLTYRKEAEEKLKLLYGPLVRRLFPRRKQRLVCAARNLTPAASSHQLLRKLEDAMSTNEPFTIYQWRE